MAVSQSSKEGMQQRLSFEPLELRMAANPIEELGANSPNLD
jgi:hypothetical protein